MALVLASCSGGRGISPDVQTVGITIGLAQTTTTSIATERDRATSLFITEPIAVPSTTTIPVTPTPNRLPPIVPTTLVVEQQHRPVTNIAEIPTKPSPGAVALTFDDGPFVGWTETILRILDDYQITATFFVSTYLLPSNADLVRRLVEAGHSVQSLGNRHQNLTEMSDDEIRSELATSIDRLVEAGAPRPTCFRPPYGATNETVNRIAAELRLEVVMWSVDSFDYSYQEPGKVIESTLADIGPGDVVLMHDQWAPVHEIALPVIIEALAERGIGFSSLCGSSPRP